MTAEEISPEAREKHTRRTAVLFFGWVLANYRGWAWLYCRRCGWWMVSGSEDLVPAWEAHDLEDHPRRLRHTR